MPCLVFIAAHKMIRGKYGTVMDAFIKSGKNCGCGLLLDEHEHVLGKRLGTSDTLIIVLLEWL